LLTDNWLAGIGARYIYFEERFAGFTYKTNIYGGALFSQYYFLESFLTHVEFESLSINNINNPEQRININSFFVGVGIRRQLGINSYASALLLYNLNDDINSPYSNPVFRINFAFGL